MIRSDYKAYNLSLYRLIKGLFTGHTFYLILSYRIGNWLYRHHVKFLPDIIKFWQLRKFACELSPYATIGEGFRIYHSTGIVIGHQVCIGNHCEVFQNVTIGSNRKPVNGREMPTIGDNVTIYSGAVVVGAIHIGDGAVISANSVVKEDVPRGAEV